MRSKGFTVIELLLTLGIFVLLSAGMFLALRQVSRVYYRSTARDNALAQLLRAKAQLLRDLTNSSQRPGTFATAKVGPNLGPGSDGDALTFLTSDDGSNGATWTPDPNGQALFGCQITYYLVVPASGNKYSVPRIAGLADGAGYEQQYPCKWLIRRVDPLPPNTSAVLPNWATWLTQPASMPQTEPLKVVADSMLQFRVLSPSPVWTMQLSAVAIQDATREIAVGSVPLVGSRFTLVQQLAVRAGN